MRQTQMAGHYKINDLYPSKDVNKLKTKDLFQITGDVKGRRAECNV